MVDGAHIFYLLALNFRDIVDERMLYPHEGIPHGLSWHMKWSYEFIGISRSNEDIRASLLKGPSNA